MNSVEKVHALLEELAELDDEELLEAMPVRLPVMTVRGLLPVVSHNVPEDPAELDAFLAGVQHFIGQIISDPEVANAAAE